jgi:ribosome-interacting GTPase 1
MMPWEDVFVQLIDTPPITADYMEGYLSSMVRGADLALLLVDLGDDDALAATDAVIQRLAQAKTVLIGQHPAEPTSEPGVEYVRTRLVANKVDLPDAAMRLELINELFGSRFPCHVIAAEHGQGLEELRNAVYHALNVIRVYTKEPGKPPDLSTPFTCPNGSTLMEMAALVHRDFAEKLKSARIWGTGVYDGQTIKRDHVLHDKDIVELHA